MIVKKRKTNNQTEIIVLSLNNVQITIKFLKLLYSSPEDFDLIMIDNGSSDQTPDILRQFADQYDNMTLVLNDENTGVIGGRNQGYEISESMTAKSKYMMFLDNDQFIEPGCISHHTSILEHGYDLIGVEAWQMNQSLMPVKKNDSLTQWFCYVGCGGMLMKREVPNKLGMFDDRFNPSWFEDPDYNWRCHKEGYKIGWNIKAKLTHLPHQTLGNAPDKAERFLKNYRKFFEKWRGHPVPKIYQANLPEFKE